MTKSLTTLFSCVISLVIAALSSTVAHAKEQYSPYVLTTMSTDMHIKHDMESPFTGHLKPNVFSLKDFKKLTAKKSFFGKKDKVYLDTSRLCNWTCNDPADSTCQGRRVFTVQAVYYAYDENKKASIVLVDMSKYLPGLVESVYDQQWKGIPPTTCNIDNAGILNVKGYLLPKMIQQ